QYCGLNPALVASSCYHFEKRYIENLVRREQMSCWDDAPLSCVLVHLSGPAPNVVARIASFTQPPTATRLGLTLKMSMLSVPRGSRGSELVLEEVSSRTHGLNIQRFYVDYERKVAYHVPDHEASMRWQITNN